MRAHLWNFLNTVLYEFSQISHRITVPFWIHHKNKNKRFHDENPPSSLQCPLCTHDIFRDLYALRTNLKNYNAHNEYFVPFGVNLQKDSKKKGWKYNNVKEEGWSTKLFLSPPNAQQNSLPGPYSWFCYILRCFTAIYSTVAMIVQVAYVYANIIFVNCRKYRLTSAFQDSNHEIQI